MERNSPGALRAPGAFGAAATFLSMRVCRRSVSRHARLLARSGAAAFGRSMAPAVPETQTLMILMRQQEPDA